MHPAHFFRPRRLDCQYDLDDGADASLFAHQHPEIMRGVVGITEETTTGVQRLAELRAQTNCSARFSTSMTR